MAAPAFGCRFVTEHSMRLTCTVKMPQLVSLLSPIIRICRWSGLSPLDLDRGIAFSPKRIDSYATLTIMWLAIEFGHFVHGFTQHELYTDWKSAPIISCIELITPIFIRVHVFVVLIESFLKRAKQVELLDRLAEIEQLFTMKLHVKIDTEQLRRKYRNYVVFWLLRIATVIGCVFLTGSWGRVYLLFLYIVPFYTSTLMYVQFLSYVGTLHYCIEVLNDETERLSVNHELSLDEQEPKTIVYSDRIERIRALRLGYQLIWRTSILINRCVHWSLPIGINNEFVTMINDLYWVLLMIANPKRAHTGQTILCVLWALVNFSNIYSISSLCEQIAAAVSLIRHRRSRCNEILNFRSIE